MLFCGGLLQGIPFGVYSTLVNCGPQEIAEQTPLTETGCGLRLRSMPCEAQGILDRLGKHLLGPWDFIWRVSSWSP